ncbi:hypothetical protein Bca4012_037742 [Brassica carinata]
MHHIPPSVVRLLVNFSQKIAGLSSGPGSSIAGFWDRAEQRLPLGPEISLGPGVCLWNLEVAQDPEVVFRAFKKNFIPEG